MTERQFMWTITTDRGTRLIVEITNKLTNLSDYVDHLACPTKSYNKSIVSLLLVILDNYSQLLYTVATIKGNYVSRKCDCQIYDVT